MSTFLAALEAIRRASNGVEVVAGLRTYPSNLTAAELAELPWGIAVEAMNTPTDYQITTRSLGARHIASPGFVPNALWKASRWSNGT